MTVYLEKNDIHSTLTTWIYCSYWQAYAAEMSGYTPYIHWPQGGCVVSYTDNDKFASVNNMYEWYFIQPYPDAAKDRRMVWMWETPNWGADPAIQQHALMNQPLSVIKSFYKKTMKFNDATNERGNQLLSKYNIDPSKTIGVTWRGTDVYLDGRPRTPIEYYYKFIDEILNENPDFRIACTAEEDGILDPLLQRYPNAFKIEEFISVPFGTKENPERHSPVRGYERGLQPVLMVWLFSKFAHYIKNRSSTGAVASWISDGRIVCLSHPETLSHDNKLDMAEINGKHYPL